MLDTSYTPVAPLHLDPPTGLPPAAAASRRLLKAYVIQMHLRGASRIEVANACGLDQDTILRWRREEGLVAPVTPKGQCRLNADLDVIKEAWDRGDLLREIAARHSASIADISEFAKRMGWPPRRRGRKAGTPSPRLGRAKEPEILALWQQGLTQEAIAARVGVTSAAIRYLAKARGWPARPDAREAVIEQVHQMVRDGFSVHAIARNLDMSRSGVSGILKSHGWRVAPGVRRPAPVAVVRRRFGPDRVARQPLPTGLSEEALHARERFKAFVLGLHQHGATMLEVCDLCGITEETFAIFRREAGLTREMPMKGHTWLEKHERELARDWLRDDVSLRSIAKRYQVSSSQLSEFARTRGWPQRSLGPKKDTRRNLGVLDAHADEVRALWDAGMPSAQIAQRFQVVPEAVGAFAKRHSWPRRLSHREQNEELVYQGIQDGLSLRAIARTFGFTRDFVGRLVQDRGWRSEDDGA